jgi:hypothetical protein
MARTPASSRRAAPTKVGKPFPWGTVVGSLVLGALLLGIVGYAALNQGSGIPELVRDPDNAIEGLSVAAEDELTRNHVAGAVDYDELPPRGGDHNIVPQTCAIYDAPDRARSTPCTRWSTAPCGLTYNDDVSEADVEELAGLIEGEPYGLMSPLPEQESPIVLTAWGRTLELDDAGDDRIADFIQAYASGPADARAGRGLPRQHRHRTGAGGRPAGAAAVRRRSTRAPPGAPPVRPPSRPRRPSPPRRSEPHAAAAQAGGSPASRRTMSISSSGSNGLVR